MNKKKYDKFHSLHFTQVFFFDKPFAAVTTTATAVFAYSIRNGGKRKCKMSLHTFFK